MKPGIPWSVKGIEPEVREAAKHAARRSGMTLGEWLNSVILDQADEQTPELTPPEPAPKKDFSAPRRPAPSPREETVVRLEDIAQQLSRLAQQEQQSAAIRPYEPPAARQQDTETLQRILNRVESNERQTVEAFTAVNERLSVLGRQIAQVGRPKPLERPEDVPGYQALEQALRNVVDHIESSERRNRDSFKSLQEQMGELAQRATAAPHDEVIQSAPAFLSLESRLSDLASRIQRSESAVQAGLPDLVRRELGQLAERIETVRATAESLANQAQSSAVQTAQKELRDIEGRILALLRDAQASFAGSQVSAPDLQRMRAEIGSLNQRIDDVRNGAASERDVHALRVAVEQLSTRVAQGPDLRPLAEMDRRLADITQRLEESRQASRNIPQVGELERRIAELDHRLAEAIRLQGDGRALEALEAQIAAVNDRIGRTENQLVHLDTIERAVTQLFEGLEQTRTTAKQVAEEAANRMADRLLAARPLESGPSPELQALEDGLRAVRESAATSDQRSQETLEAVHETLEQIVSKLAELETAAAGHQLAASMAQQASAAPQAASVWSEAPVAQPAAAPGPVFFEPEPSFHATAPEPQAPASNPFVAAEELPQPPLAAPGEAVATSPFVDSAAALAAGGDDFIAAARRAAQMAATKPSTLGPAPGPMAATEAPAKRGFKFSLPFSRSKKPPKTAAFLGGAPVPPLKAANSNDGRRRRLLLAGLVLLAAVSAFTFNMVSKPPRAVPKPAPIEQKIVPETKAPAQSGALELPAEVPAAEQISGLPSPDEAAPNEAMMAVEQAAQSHIITGSLPVAKTDASISALIAEPGTAPEKAEMPPAEIGSQALREAAARGNPTAQFIVASRYLDGEPVARDFTKAAYWYQQAASRGLAPAQYRLATLFERGKGVPQDMATALVWYERAAAGGNVKAMHNAAVIAAGNQAGTPNYDRAFKWFSAAAERGLKDSQFNLAVLYERGLGTRANSAEAMFWYSLAGRQNDQDAAKRAADLSRTMSPDVVASLTQRLQAWKPLPSVEDANMVAVTEGSWQLPATGETAAATPDTANPVLTAQRLLTKLGFNIGEPDGVMGTRTANAIRLFQLQSGLRVNGEVSSELIAAMQAKAG